MTSTGAQIGARRERLRRFRHVVPPKRQVKRPDVMLSRVEIYTRTGDGGSTALYFGGRVSKADPIIECLGDVDETVTALGVARALCHDAELAARLLALQRDLFVLGADLCVPEQTGRPDALRMPEEAAAELEALIDRLDAELDPLRNFILPGGTPAAAHFHLARTICRRAERKLVLLNGAEPIGPRLIRYLNRLSDLLFVLARVENARRGQTEITWDGRS